MKPVMARGSGIVLFSGLFVYLFIARSFACFGLTSYCNKVGRRLASRISENANILFGDAHRLFLQLYFLSIREQALLI